MTRDQVFVPKTASQVGITFPRPVGEAVEDKEESFLDKVDDLLEDAPLYLVACLITQQLCTSDAFRSGRELILLLQLAGPRTSSGTLRVKESTLTSPTVSCSWNRISFSDIN